MKAKFCIVEGCSCHSVSVLGLCGKHKARYLKYGTVDLPVRILKTCYAPDCSKKVHAHGLCHIHCDRLQRNGNFDLQKKNTTMICSLEGCSTSIKYKRK